MRYAISATTTICLLLIGSRIAGAIEPLSNPLQQFAASGTCQFPGDCAITFPAAAATRTLILHASCEFFLGTGGTVQKAELSGPSSNARDIFPAFSYAAGSGGKDYGIDAETYLFFEQGERPRIDVVSSGAPVQSLDCTISGYHL